MNPREYASRLIIVNVFEQHNASGITTDKRLYDTRVPDSHAPGWAADGKGRGGIKHATVGKNSLRYLAGGSIADNRWVSAHYLLPKDDFTVHKLIPDGYGANHCYPGTWREYVNNINSRFYGFEVENLQDGKDIFTFGQYMKLALVWAYLSARDKIMDVYLADHGVVAPPGHRTDPYTKGVWDDALFYGLLWSVRQPENWPNWGLPLWTGR